MGKAATITVRVDEALKRGLERRAKRERRSLSAQVEHELATALRDETSTDAPVMAGSFLGRYEGTKVPSEADFAEIRQLLWGALPRKLR